MGDAAGVVDPQAALDAMFGAGRLQVVESACTTRVTETEVVLVNGAPVRLVGAEGAALKEALLAGRVPEQGLLTRLLTSVLGGDAARLKAVSGEVNVRSKLSGRQDVSVVRAGEVVDTRSAEWKSDSESVASSVTTKSRPATASKSNHPPPPSASFSSTQSPSPSSSRPWTGVSTAPMSPSPRTTPSPSSLRTSSSSPSTNDLSRTASSSSSSTAPGSISVPSRNLQLDLDSRVGRVGRSPAPGKRIWPGKGSGPCLSPELEESLARTSIKDPTGLRTADLSALKKQQLTQPHINCSQDQKEALRQKNDLGSAHKTITKPSIFGTVADNHTPSTKRGIPQTSKGQTGGLEGSEASQAAWKTDDDNSLVYEEGVLVSGCLGALVLHATPTATYYPDAAYLFAFLLSARLFIKPHELLQKICNLGFTQQGMQKEDISTVNKAQLGQFVPHMVQLLGEWSETFPYDFRDERMMSGVRMMTHRCIALQPSLRRDVTQVLHNLLNKLTLLERYEENLAKLTVPPPAEILPPVPDITEACGSALMLAQQLTHVELDRLSYIGPEEFVQAFAKDNLEATYKDLKKTNNLESYVQWFNRLSYLVATQACSPVKKKQRVRVIETWIEVARECFNIGNFNSLMGIIAGLNMSPVARLKKTWSKVQTAKFSVLEHQMEPSSNFSSYRSTLKAAMWRSAGAVDDRQKIVIPFFSLLVKDLYFLNEGCANRLPNKHINFDKFWQLAKQVTEFMAWKQVTCPFERDPQMLRYLQSTPILSETGLALASFEGESPENSYEKDRYKLLKATLQNQQQH